jgi:hypothetical protein
MTRFTRRAFTFAAATLVLSAPLQAQGAYFSSDNLGYTGALTCYGSLADAANHANSTCNSVIPQRDLSMFFVDNNAAFAGLDPATEAIFLTNWWSNNQNNPNNQNYGFVQMYDNDGGSVSAMSMGWDPTLTVFQLAASGGPTITGCTTYPPQDCGRLWNGQSPSAQANGGSFVTWSVNATFSGFTAATFNSATGVYESVSEPTSATGSINAIFADATTGQFYDIDASINSTSWAAGNGFAGTTVAGAPVTATPEPASLALMATGLGGLGGFIKRRRRKSSAV